jgi:hypothetical protein
MSTPAPIARPPINIALVVEAKTPFSPTPEALAAALTRQANEHLSPAWWMPAVNVHVATSVPAGHMALVMLDDADQAGALGYHDLTDAGQPIGKVFVKTTLDDGEVVSVTASHELLEMLLDPGCATAIQATDTAFFAFELCDPVQDKTYEIDGVAVSDFVYPAWFQGYRKPGSVQFSYLKSIDAPFALTAGGYVSMFSDGKWTQAFGGAIAKQKFNPARKRRAMRRNAHNPK